MTSFDTTEDDVERFAAGVRAALDRRGGRLPSAGAPAADRGDTDEQARESAVAVTRT